ncbi:DUF4254 domain-containing protein [Nocardia sp. GCM10030253]|uniref:DUF4254 domain-containing protein n=1 Tax=Nocardia sp. GCM10030253 TaxID=3273404 RepID=UPI003629DB6A
MTIHDAQQFRRRQTAAAPQRPGLLPNAEELMEAIHDDGSSNHPLAVSASHAGSLHRRRMDDPARVAEIDTHRGQLITAIDMWVSRNVPTAHTGPTMHTEGLGPVVDRLAERLVQAEHATRSLPPNHTEARRARNRLDEISTAYDALVAEVLGGKRQLPRATARR